MDNRNLLKQINKVDWEYVINRREALLFRSLTDTCYQYQVIGIHWKPKYILRLISGEFYHSHHELEGLRNSIAEYSDRLGTDFKTRLLKYIGNLDRLASRIEEIDCNKLNHRQIISLLVSYYQAALKAHCFLLPFPVGDSIIASEIIKLLLTASDEQKRRWLAILSSPAKENSHTQEERSLYRLAIAYQVNKQQYIRLLRKHVNKYAWIGARGYYFDNAWNKKDIEARVKNLFFQGKNPAKELKYLDNFQKDQKRARTELIKELKIDKNPRLYRLVKLASEFAYIRTWRTDLIYRAGYKVRHLFYKVADNLDVSHSDIIYLTFQEIITSAKKGESSIPKSEIIKRQQFFAAFLLQGKYQVLSGNIWKQLLKNYKHSSKQETEFTGTSAYTGKVIGKAKIVMQIRDISKVQAGDILVAPMTFPNFIAAMEKASAFVTDEGGILCHAAIISREMKKPCIIGTKIATQVLKDGDLVEVDANKRIVKILKKSRFK
ncbi:MAG: PEP-utilizing enzyme [Patescibacteria group bacterium]